MAVRPKVSRMRALVRYYKDKDASVLGKLVVFAALAYVIFPYDLIPDVPVIGWLDDLGVMGLASAWLSRVLGKYREAPATQKDGNTDAVLPVGLR